MSAPDAPVPGVVFHPPATPQRITLSLADLLEHAVVPPAERTATTDRIAELASELLTELRRLESG